MTKRKRSLVALGATVLGGIGLVLRAADWLTAKVVGYLTLPDDVREYVTPIWQQWGEPMAALDIALWLLVAGGFTSLVWINVAPWWKGHTAAEGAAEANARGLEFVLDNGCLFLVQEEFGSNNQDTTWHRYWIAVRNRSYTATVRGVRVRLFEEDSPYEVRSPAPLRPIGPWRDGADLAPREQQSFMLLEQKVETEYYESEIDAMRRYEKTRKTIKLFTADEYKELRCGYGEVSYKIRLAAYGDDAVAEHTLFLTVDETRELSIRPGEPVDWSNVPATGRHAGAPG